MIKTRQFIDSFNYILNRLLIIFFFTLIIIYASHEIVDLDIWLHLKTGEVVLKSLCVPSTDIFSFSLGAKPWISHEWLFQALSYLCFYLGQGDGLLLMQNIVILCLFFLLFFMGTRKENHIFVFIILYLTLLTLAYRFTVRPDIFSLFFLTFYLFVLKKNNNAYTPAIWLLPFCQILWVNMHGFFFTGPLIVLIFLIAEIIKRTLPLPYAWNQTQRYSDRQIKQLLIILALLLLASLVNPYGLKGAAYPFSVFGQISGKGKIVFQYIQELAKPIALKNILNLQNFLYFKVMILISFFSFRINQKNINVADIMLWVFFLFFSTLAIRNVAYFAILAAYCIFNNIDLAVNNKKEFPRFGSKKAQVLASYSFILILFYFPAHGAMKYAETTNYNFDTYKLKSSLWGISELRYPKKAVDFLLKNKFPARMFNDFNSGAYLIGQAYPKRQVYIDGRTELYGPDFFQEYVNMGEGKRSTINTVLSRYMIKGFFLTNSVRDLHMGLLAYLFKSSSWKCVYFDESAIIFLKDSPENAGLIRKYAIDLRKWSPPETDFLQIGIAQRFPGPFLTRARLLNSLGCYEAAAKEAQAALDIMPNNSEAFKFLEDYNFENKNYLEAFKYARKCLIYSQGDLAMRARLAHIYHCLKDDKKAFKVIDAIIKKNPKFALGYYTKALILKEADINKAIDLLRKAISISSKDPRFHELLGDLLAQKAKQEDAKNEWLKALEYDSANEALIKKIKSG